MIEIPFYKRIMPKICTKYTVHHTCILEKKLWVLKHWQVKEHVITHI